MKRLELKLQCKVSFPVDDEIRNTLTRVFDHSKATGGKNDGKSFQPKVVTALLEMETCDGVDGDEDKSTKAEDFADWEIYVLCRFRKSAAGEVLSTYNADCYAMVGGRFEHHQSTLSSSNEELISVIRNAFNQNRMAREGDDAPQNARAEVKEARERRKLMFL